MDIDISIKPKQLEKAYQEVAQEQLKLMTVITAFFYPIWGVNDWFYANEYTNFLLIGRGLIFVIAIIVSISTQIYLWHSLIPFYILIGLPILHASLTCVLIPPPYLSLSFTSYSLFLLATSFFVFWKPFHTQIIVGLCLCCFFIAQYALGSISFDLGIVLMNGGIFWLSTLIVMIPIQQWQYTRTTKKIKDELVASKSKAQLYLQQSEIAKQKKLVDDKNESLTEQKQKLEATVTLVTESIQYAQRIQQAILSDEEKGLQKFKSSFVFFQPRDIISGDFYWFSDLGEKQVVIMADCTGHGVPGAFMTMLGATALNEIINEGNVTTPAEVLYALDKKIFQNLHAGKNTVEDGMDLGILFFEKGKQQILYAGAKIPLYYRYPNRLMKTIRGNPFPVGSSQFQDEKQFENHQIEWQEDTWFYLASDGFQDQFGGKQDKKFMKSNFRQLLFEMSKSNQDRQLSKLQETFTDWKQGKEQTDDVLVIGVQI